MPGGRGTTVTHKRILITGATGCVGRRIVARIAAQTPHEQVLVVRDPTRLEAWTRDHPRITLVTADMRAIGDHRAEIGAVDAAVLAAAAWGGPEAFQLNLDANRAAAALVTDGGRVFYFSSASVLARNGALLSAADALGTDYIRSKFQLVGAMEAMAERVDMVGLFPTLVIGGTGPETHSHFARLLIEAGRWAGLVRRLSADGRFHFIHAEDIARIVTHLVDAPAGAREPAQRLVLGNPAMTVDGFVEAYCAHIGRVVGRRLRLRDWMAESAIRAFRIRLSPWDRYCMEHRELDFEHAVTPTDFGLDPYCANLSDALESIGIPRATR